MKISILQKNFKRGLGLVESATGKNINLPILNNVLIRAEDGRIDLISTNLEIGITHTLRGKVEKEGGFTVDGKILTNYAALLPNDKVDIERKGNQVEISCGKYKTKLKGVPADDFPLIPVVEKKIRFTVKDAKILKEALLQVVFSVSLNESRLELSGVQFNFEGNELILAATDSYRLAEKKIAVKAVGGSGSQKIIVPARTIQELVKVLSNIGDDDALEGGAEVNCYVSDSQILFSVDSVELVSRLIDGQFPEYTQIIPKNVKTEVLVNRQELLRAVKTSSIFTKSDVNDINLDIPGGKTKVVISSSSDSVGENVVEIEAAVKGSDNYLVLNYRYLIDGLNNIKSEMIKIEVLDNNSPCILRPENDPNYLYLIMPIKQ